MTSGRADQQQRDRAEQAADPLAPVPTAPPGRGAMAALGRARDAMGETGLFPVALLTLIAAAERLDDHAFGVLSPEIRDAFGLSNAQFVPIVTLTSVLPILMAVPIANWADRTNRVWLSAIAALLWGGTAIATGLAPVLAVLLVARFIGGVGSTVNQPVHGSLLSDWYRPAGLASIFALYLFGSTGAGLVGGPLAGVLGSAIGWRPTFVLLALPTFVCAAFFLKLREPQRGQSAGVVQRPEPVSIAEGFRRVGAVRSLRRTWWSAVFFGAGVVSYASLFNLYLRDVYHLGPAARGTIGLVTGVAGLGGFVLAGRLSQAAVRQGRPERLPIVNGLLVISSAVGILIVATAPVVGVSVAATALVGLGVSGFLVPYQTTVALVTAPRLRSQAYGWSLVFFTLGAVAVSAIIGAVADAHGHRFALTGLAGCVAVGGAIAYSVTRLVRWDIAQALRAEEAARSDALLTVSGLEAGYDQVQVLFGVDLQVREGEIVALLGTNGAGKSTLLRAISGLIPPSGGTILFEGRDITHVDPVAIAKLIAHVPGGRGVFPTLTVDEHFQVASWLIPDKAEVGGAIEDVFRLFPRLRERHGQLAGDLSGGEQQQLALGMAFLARPKLLLVDELTLGLAPTVVEQLLQTIREIHAQGTTIVLVEQSVNIALTVAGRVYFLEKGEVRFEGPASELLQRHDLVRSVFLQEAARAGFSSGNRDPGTSSTLVVDENSAPILSAQRVSKTFGGVHALDLVDVEVRPGEVVGIMGPNGAGKTTVFDVLSGFLQPDGGQVLLGGFDVTRMSPDARARMGLGRSFQDARIFPSLTVAENLAMALERHIAVHDHAAAALGLPAVAEAEEDVAWTVYDLVELMGLQAFRNKFVSELSTGSRRVVDLAMALCHGPAVLLLDEPSSGIAQRETEALGPLLQTVRHEIGCALLLIEHDMPLIAAVSDRLVAMDQGQVIAVGTPDEVLHDPKVVGAYLGTDANAISRSGAVPPDVALEGSAQRTRTEQARQEEER